MNAKEKLLLKLHEHFPTLTKGSGLVVLNMKIGRPTVSGNLQRKYLLEQGLISEPHPDWVCVLTELGKQEVKKLSFRAIAAELFGDDIPKGYLFFIDAEEDRSREEQFDNSIQAIENAIQYYSSRPESSYFQIKLKEFQEKLEPVTQIINKIAELKTLSTRRPLLAREKTELDFLQKMLKADSLADLQSIENEVISTPTDPELIKRLLHNLNEKKGFY